MPAAEKPQDPTAKQLLQLFQEASGLTDQGPTKNKNEVPEPKAQDQASTGLKELQEELEKLKGIVEDKKRGRHQETIDQEQAQVNEAKKELAKLKQELANLASKGHESGQDSRAGRSDRTLHTPRKGKAKEEEVETETEEFTFTEDKIDAAGNTKFWEWAAMHPPRQQKEPSSLQAWATRLAAPTSKTHLLQIAQAKKIDLAEEITREEILKELAAAFMARGKAP